MDPDQFKALLAVLERIADALDGEAEAVNVANGYQGQMQEAMAKQRDIWERSIEQTDEHNRHHAQLREDAKTGQVYQPTGAGS